MYLEPNKCATCGKLLDPSAKHAPQNVALNAFSKSYSYRPMFCSPSCIDSHIIDPALANAVKVNKETLEASYNEDHANAVRAADEMLEWSLSSIRIDFETSDERRYKDGLSRATTDDQIDYFKEEYRKDKQRRDDKAKERREWHAISKRKADNELEQKLSETRSGLRQRQPELRQQALKTFFDEFQAARERQEADRPAPPEITERLRFEHTHILGPSGSGKTTIIQELVLTDLRSDSPPAMVVIDPKGFMVERLGLVADRRRLVYIDPVTSPPPLNIFKQKDKSLINQAIANFDYIFAQAGSALTSKMRPVFKFCAKLMFSIPDANIFLFMDLLESQQGDARFAPYIAQLDDPGAKRFFERDFFAAKLYGETRQQIKGRLNDILSMPELLAMFTDQGCLNFRQLLDSGFTVLVNTRASEIGLDASQLLGRYIIALTLSAAFARGKTGLPTFLYIDEFQDFVDEEATPRQFRLAREYNLGIIAAHQNMFCNEITESLRTVIAGNTAIKYCAKLSGSDRSFMLRELGCTDEFLERQVVDRENKRVNFACAVRGFPTFQYSIKYPNITPAMYINNPSALLDFKKPVPTAQPSTSPVDPLNSSIPRSSEAARPADSPPSPNNDDADSATGWYD